MLGNQVTHGLEDLAYVILSSKDKNLFCTLAPRLVCLFQSISKPRFLSCGPGGFGGWPAFYLSFCFPFGSLYALHVDKVWKESVGWRKYGQSEVSEANAKACTFFDFKYALLLIDWYATLETLQFATSGIKHFYLGSETLTSNVVFSFGIFTSQCLLTEHRRVSRLCWFG